MKKFVKSWIMAALISLPFLFTECTDKGDLYDPNFGKEELKPESAYFDFSTTRKVSFDVNYGKIGGKALIEIFTKNPVVYGENGSYTVEGEAVYKVFADAEGRFAGEVELPTAVSTVYIYSSNWGVPLCMSAKVENGKVVLDMGESDSRAASRVAENLQVWNVEGYTDLFAVTQWSNNKYGKVTDPNDIVRVSNAFSSADMDAVKKKLWKGALVKPNPLNNSELVTDTEHVNTVVRKTKRTNEKGEEVEVTGAELWLTFLDEFAWHQNAIGYYYYPSDQVPDSYDKVKKYILFPNASVPGHVPYLGGSEDIGTKKVGNSSYYNWGAENAPIKAGTKIQLLYVDPEGNVKTEFPTGLTIGYFIIPKEHVGADNNQADTYRLPAPESAHVYCSNKEWNASRKSRFISLATTNGTIVYGIEDSTDNTSYDDILFCIDADPKEAIQDPDRPTIDDPKEEDVEATETTYRTYAYEDIWPTGGDYDLNDVIVEHKRVVTFNSNGNSVTKVEDTFTPVQPAGSATYTDAFAVQYAQRGTITIPEGAVDEAETKSVILFADAKTAANKAFAVTRTFESGSMQKASVDAEDLNPFIIANYAAGAGNRTEVHLPKKKATTKADTSLQGEADDAYYVNKAGKYPFAILIPMGDGTKHFTPVTETVNIGVEYALFNSWAESNGEKNADWYTDYKKVSASK